MAINHSDFKNFGLDSANNEVQFILLNNQHIEKNWTFSKGPLPVLVLTEDECRKKNFTDFFEITNICVDGSNAILNYAYPRGAHFGEITFSFNQGKWILTGKNAIRSSSGARERLARFRAGTSLPSPKKPACKIPHIAYLTGGVKYPADLKKSQSLSGTQMEYRALNRGIRYNPKDFTISGNLPKNAAYTRIRSKYIGVLRCYQITPFKEGFSGGSMRVHFEMTSQNKVKRAWINEVTVNNPAFEKCVIDDIKSWKFRYLTLEKNVEVSQRIQLTE